MFGLPGPTEFDVRFRLFGIPVRVHPLFWAMAVILGWNSIQDGTVLLTWVGCVFVSILVHEFGHALTARHFGAQPDVLLYSMGGLCVYQNPRESPWRRFFVLVMGPGSGFLLMAATIAVASLWLRISPLDVWGGHLGMGRRLSHHAAVAIYFLIEINFFWGLINLLPILPLDGGQIAMVFLTMHNGREGRRRSYILSVVTAGLVAIYFVRTEQYYNALLFGLLAMNSFQVLQVLHHQSRFGNSHEDESDWWKR